MSLPASAKHIITVAIDRAFNAILLEAFLCSLYTMLFAYTFRTLLHKQDKKAYAMMLTFLWVLVMVSFAFDWQYHRTAFVITNDSPIDIFDGVTMGPNIKSIGILDNVFSMCCNLLADALLIWRCFILWEDKRWVLVPLPILLTASVVLGSLYNVSQFTHASQDQNSALIFITSFFAVSIGITLMGTSLIVLRILLVTRSSPLTNHTSAYRKIQRILVESGILYTITMFISGITLLIEIIAHKPTSTPLNDLATYTTAILVPLSGIAPTLIAVRVSNEAAVKTNAGASRTRSHSRVLSRLTFRRTVRQTGIIDAGDVVSGHGETPTDSSTGFEGHKGPIEKMVVDRLDATP